jgi:hypothetical protein
MPEYRYTLDRSNSSSQPAEIIECKTDQQAIEKAHTLLKLRDIEIWTGARCVTRIKAPDVA